MRAAGAPPDPLMSLPPMGVVLGGGAVPAGHDLFGCYAAKKGSVTASHTAGQQPERIRHRQTIVAGSGG